MILITGATGNVGREVVARLRSEGHAVRAVSRRPGRARLPADVEVVAGDLDDPASVRPALEGATAVFLMGRNNLAEQAAGLLAGLPDPEIPVVLLSSASVEVETPEAVARWRLGTRRHVLAEQAVRRYAKHWTFLRPGAFSSNAALKWSASIRERGVAELMFADEPEAPIDPLDIAEVAVRVLTESGHSGHAYTLTGPESLLQAEQVRVIGEVTGRDIAVEVVPPDVQRERLRGMVPPEDLDVAMRRGRMPWEEPTPAVARLLGRPARTFREWAVRNRTLFTPL
jgi:uncharacterized protein YbjT (DUF2867 family)